MQVLEQFWNNKILVAALAAWLIAQVIKTILHLIVNHKFKLERMIGSGGMPSSHAAIVCALVAAVAKQFGLSSFEFAISFILAIVVLHDARGVRLETGKQAVTITAIIRHFVNEGEVMDLPDLELKELIGHTAIQVLVGGIIGVGVGLWIG